MTNPAVITDKSSAVRKYLTILARYEKLSAAELERDDEKRGAVERYLYLAVQATIDLAEAFIAFREFRTPTTFSEAFGVLQENKIIAHDLAEKLENMAKFRNLLAHDYEDMNYEIVTQILRDDLTDIESFLKKIAEAL